MSTSPIRVGEILNGDDFEHQNTHVDPPRFADGSRPTVRPGVQQTRLGLGVVSGSPEPRIARASTPPPPAPAPARVAPVTERPAPAPAPAAAPTGWSDFEAMGLGKKKSAAGTKAAKAVVSIYRVLGFGVLSLIVLILIGYIATTTFYFLNHTWVAPVTVSASDDKVVALRSQLAEQQNQRDRIAADLDDADRGIVAEEQFQAGFVRAIKSDLAGRQSTLGRVRALEGVAAAARSDIHRSSDQFAQQQRAQMAQEYDAHLIDRSTMIAGKYQLAQISGENLSLAERQVELETQATALANEASSLDALLTNSDGQTALSYDVLKIKRDFDTSKRELARALENRRMLAASLAREDSIIAGLKQSSYLRALDDHATVAMIPYENLESVAAGSALYGCRFAMVDCHQVGTVLEVLPGEVQFKHPHRDTEVRGQMIELKMTDPDAAQDEVLFLGRAPLWL
jgi:hypothetical protein